MAPSERRSLPGRPLVGALLAVVACAVFAPSLGHGFVFDDHQLLTLNERWRGLSREHLAWMVTTFHNGHWQPLTWITWALDHAAGGMDPAGYHRTNVALHGVCTALAFLLIARLLELSRGDEPGAAPRTTLLAAAFGALVFALHPLRVESVTYVTERRDVLSVALLLASVLAWLRWRTAASGGLGWFALSLALYALSLGAKAWGITLPAVLVILSLWPLAAHRAELGRPGTILRAILRSVLPFALVALVPAWLARQAQAQTGAMLGWDDYPLLGRLGQAAYGLVFYPWKTLVPTGLSPLYELDTGIRLLQPLPLVCAVVGLGITGVLVAQRRRFPAALAAWLAYAAMVSPVLGLSQSGPQLVADRYAYLACLPFAVLAAAGARWAARRAPQPTWIACAVIAIALGTATVRQQGFWVNDLTLWTRAIACDPENAPALNNRGLVLSQVGNLDGALADFDRALAADPDHAKARANRGGMRLGRGDYDGAIADLSRAIELGEDGADVYFLRGEAHRVLDLRADAIADYRRALEVAPQGWHLTANALGQIATLETP